MQDRPARQLSQEEKKNSLLVRYQYSSCKKKKGQGTNSCNLVLWKVPIMCIDALSYKMMASIRINVREPSSHVYPDEGTKPYVAPFS